MRTLYKSIGFAVACFILATAVAAADEIGTILVNDLNVRAGPGKMHEILSQLAKGMKVRILARENGWLKIERNGMIGFILDRQRFVAITALNERAPLADNRSQQAKVEELRGRAETLQEQLKASQSELKDVKRKEKEAIQAFNAAEQALNRTRIQVREAQAELADLHQKIEKIEHRSAELEKEISDNEVYAKQRLVALYKLHWVGRIQLLATADSFFDFINRKNALERILDRDEALLEKMRQDRNTLESLLEQLNTRKAERRSLELTLKERLATLNAEQEKRSAMLNRIRGKKELAMAALQGLKEAAQELDTAIEKIQPAVTQAKPQETEAAEALAFEAHKGLLSWPVKGKIISFFGPYQDEKYNVTNFQSGINIQAERGEPIRAVSSGHAIFSSWFKGFGNMLIIDHGDHFYTVYAHLEEVFKVKGDRVEKGEVIATVGDSGSIMGPALHFEVRHHGKPLDPLAWIQKG